jgi:hypothetical protein
MKFKIISHLTNNSVSELDKFIIEDGERQITQISNEFIHMDNGIKFPIKMFNRWFRLELHMKEVEKRYKLTSEKLKQLEIDTRKVLSVKPIQALRFTILKNWDNDSFSWAFGNAQTSHSTLETEFLKVNKGSWRAVSGGFYNFIIGNAKCNLDKYWSGTANFEEINEGMDNTLFLFGKSDSYGLNKEFLTKAIPFLYSEKIISNNVVVKILTSF